ncbi:hypothetical protein Tco_0744469 [Tanacetum coccineum]
MKFVAFWGCVEDQSPGPDDYFRVFPKFWKSAFLPNRQILDGPFILSELLSWCKFKYNQVMVFKVDFAKAYDSIRWDYLDDVLNSFGFGSKWRSGFVVANFWKGPHFSQWKPDIQVFIRRGLSINVKKSQLLGIGISDSIVSEAAKSLGCSIMKTPFKSLGITVPQVMLSSMESLRRNFFNGIQEGDKKIAWVKWPMVLASKKHGGLGVSSFYALNRGLLFKWVWRYISQDNSLWARVISALHGSSSQVLSASFSSLWKSILNEVKSLKAQGVDLISHCKIRVGNECDKVSMRWWGLGFSLSNSYTDWQGWSNSLLLGAMSRRSV